MKRYIIGIALVMTAVAMFAPGILHAQSNYVLAGKIPFAFGVGKSTLPAGDYIFKSNPAGTLTIQNKDRSTCAIAITSQDKPNKAWGSKTGKVQFTVYGDHYFLSRVVNPAAVAEYKVHMSESERELTKLALGAKTAVIAMVAH
jgi:hypothetical protein